MKTVTIEDVLSFGPCWKDARERMENITEKYNQQNWTALDVLRLPETLVSTADKLWLVLRDELIGPKILHEFACRCAERALSRINNPDPRSVAAIAAKRAWLKGEITDDELKTAYDAAAAAARTANADDDAARWAARSAAYAAYSAIFAAAYWATYAAEVTAERTWQVKTLIKMLEEEP